LFKIKKEARISNKRPLKNPFQNDVQNNSGFDGRAKTCQGKSPLAVSAGQSHDIHILLNLMQGMNPFLTNQNDAIYNK